MFQFDGKHYCQDQGTAMGTKRAPVYANIYLGDWLFDVGGGCHRQCACPGFCPGTGTLTTSSCCGQAVRKN